MSPRHSIPPHYVFAVPDKISPFLAFSSFIIPIIGTILGNQKIEKSPEPIKIQIKEAERAIIYKDFLRPNIRFDDAKSLHEKAGNVVSSLLPDTADSGRIKTLGRQPPGVPLVYEGDTGNRAGAKRRGVKKVDWGNEKE